jgi:hypothetical protein
LLAAVADVPIQLVTAEAVVVVEVLEDTEHPSVDLL